MKELNPAERRALRARAHALHPIVMVGGAGLTVTVLKEIDLALKSHELIKIRMLGEDRDARERALEQICIALDAGPVQLIGKILIVFRPKPEQAKGTEKAKVKQKNRRSVPEMKAQRRAKRKFHHE